MPKRKKKNLFIFQCFPTLRTTPWSTCGMRYCMASARNVNTQTQSKMWWVSKTWISGTPDLAGGKHSWIATKLLLPQNQNKAPKGSTDVNQLSNPILQSSTPYQLEDKRVSARKPIHIRTFWLKAGQSGHHPSVLKLSFHQLLSCIWGQGSPGTSRGDRLSCCCFDGEVPGAMQLPRLGAMHVHLGWRPLVSLSSWYRQLE